MLALRHASVLHPWRSLITRGIQSTAACFLGVGAAGSADTPVLLVEYCVLCNYKPRFDLLKARVHQEFPNLEVREDTEDHRQGAFEVALHHGGRDTLLWSKLITGEPSDLEATDAVAELVVRDLRRHLPQAQ